MSNFKFVSGRGGEKTAIGISICFYFFLVLGKFFIDSIFSSLSGGPRFMSPEYLHNTFINILWLSAFGLFPASIIYLAYKRIFPAILVGFLLPGLLLTFYISAIIFWVVTYKTFPF